MNNNPADQPAIQVSGVLPLRRPAALARLSPRDPALHGMTDFTRTVPISVAPERPLDDALSDMIRFGVRALLVGHADHVVGLITSYDIEGVRPARRGSTRVVELMTGWDDLPTIGWATMQSACIADLLEIFQGVGVMHLVVVEDAAGGMPLVRGLVCRSRIERRLSVPEDGAQQYLMTG
jgi:CBS domain-containing protein